MLESDQEKREWKRKLRKILWYIKIRDAGKQRNETGYSYRGKKKNQKSKPGTIIITYDNLCSISIHHHKLCHVMSCAYDTCDKTCLISNDTFLIWGRGAWRMELKDGKHFASWEMWHVQADWGVYAFVPIGVRFGLHKTHSWSPYDDSTTCQGDGKVDK